MALATKVYQEAAKKAQEESKEKEEPEEKEEDNTVEAEFVEKTIKSRNTTLYLKLEDR